MTPLGFFWPRIRVEFDPAFKVDRVCGTVKQKLSIVYQAATVCNWIGWTFIGMRHVIQTILNVPSKIFGNLIMAHYSNIFQLFVWQSIVRNIAIYIYIGFLLLATGSSSLFTAWHGTKITRLFPGTGPSTEGSCGADRWSDLPQSHLRPTDGRPKPFLPSKKKWGCNYYARKIWDYGLFEDETSS